jgi:AGZA family xanthine/uracil permease-like MFS transporter
VLAALAVVVNGIPQGLIALSFGFAAFPTSVAFLVGAVGSFAFNSVATISFQAETITLAGKMGKDIRERLSLVFWGGLFLLIPSIFGLNELIVKWIGAAVVDSMMAGVGIMLAYVAIDLFNSEKISGGASLVTGIAVWFFTLDLTKTIIISVFVSTVVYNILKKQGKVPEQNLVLDATREKFTMGNIEWKVWQHPNILFSALAIALPQYRS